MSTDNPNLVIDEKQLAMVDAKIRESKALTSGVMSSWSRPMEGITEGPSGKITPPKPQEKESPITQGGAKYSKTVDVNLISIPSQAMKSFKQLLPLFETLEVKFTQEQKLMFLESLQSMKTPSNMADAKAIFDLMEALAK